jgi:hypothetical protein
METTELEGSTKKNSHFLSLTMCRACFLKQSIQTKRLSLLVNILWYNYITNYII